MSNDAIQVRGLGKQYRLGEGQGRRYKALRDVISGVFTGEKQVSTSKDTFWALQDVSFDVPHGEVLGVIGRNGAGKSTLLKILTRITEPTTGEIRLRGRVGSLLEVGTGFHPELTGRENIYLNGAILGMRRKEITRKFDEIVDFAEIEQFIDTPAKRYSSGMYMRLAFAVAAHLDPEILLVDEVLAVGDAAFQKKCLGKMGDVARSGRTVLFVSHDMGAIRSLTQICLYLKKGEIAFHSSTEQVVSQYLKESLQLVKALNSTIDINFYRRSIVSKPAAQFTNVGVNGYLNKLAHIQAGDSFTIWIELKIFQRIAGANLTIVLKNAQGQRIAVFFSWDAGLYLDFDIGKHDVSLKIENLPLAPGEYFADIGLNQSTNTPAFDVILDVPLISVVNTGQITQWLERPWGSIHWEQVKWGYNG